jgi:hypothetical protein
MEVFQCPDTAVDSMRKNTVAATIEMEMIQKEMATVSLGLRKPCKSRAMFEDWNRASEKSKEQL